VSTQRTIGPTPVCGFLVYQTKQKVLLPRTTGHELAIRRVFGSMSQKSSCRLVELSGIFY
jgi:hypothetical protein